MIEKYKCIMQDTYDNLKLGKIYKIKNKRYVVSDIDDTIILFGITQWQLNNLFKSEVK